METRQTVNTLAKKKDKMTMICKTLLREVKMEQHETYKKMAVLQNGNQFLLH